MIRKILTMVMVCVILTGPVHALDLTAPAVPASGAERMPTQIDSFGEAVLAIVTDALRRLRPD